MIRYVSMLISSDYAMLEDKSIPDYDVELLDADELELEEESLFREIRIIADRGQSPIRIDKFLIDHVANTSRNKIQQAADAGSISVNGKVVKSNYKVKPLDEIVETKVFVWNSFGGMEPLTE